MAVRRRAVVHGRVQGVFFRDSCRREATRLGVSGWVTNRLDGAVELVAEGEPDAVDALLGWARRGPARARVSGLDVTEEELQGEAGFRVV